jgi:hypothetical protein
MVTVRDQSDVVGDDHHFRGESFRPCNLGSEAEVEAVARVVLHDQQGTRGAGYGADRVEHGIRGGRREHLARYRGA